MLKLLSVNWYSAFYWITVADGVKTFFDKTSNIFTWFAVLSFIALVVTSVGKSITISENNITTDEEEGKDSDVRSWERFRKYSSRFFYWMLVMAMVTWAGYVFTPTKKDSLLIVAGGAGVNFLTKDSSANKLPSDLFNYVHIALKEQTKNLTDDTKEALGIKPVVPPTVKETLLEKAKNLTKEELINYLTDSTKPK